MKTGFEKKSCVKSPTLIFDSQMMQYRSSSRFIYILHTDNEDPQKIGDSNKVPIG